MSNELNTEQKAALKILKKSGNVFLTGAAGSGKSFLMRAYLKDNSIPILASTGAAAILVGGRTFHSFFGLGILEGGVQATIDRALKNKRLVKRLKKTDSVVIDEISMISGPTLRAAESIAKKARENTTPWGGLRVIAVGDFAQLPPVNPFSKEKEWAFLEDAWHMSEFKPIVLSQVMRANDPEYLKVLNEVRDGRMNERVKGFLNSRTSQPLSEEPLTRLFPRREEVERYNLERLSGIKNQLHSFDTSYEGKEKEIETFRKHSPVSEVIQLKKGALVMLRQNDPEGRWVNGTLGEVNDILQETLSVKLFSGKVVEVEKTSFTLLNAEGKPVVTARNFPVSLAWAMTIHKAQGATLDRMRVDLRRIWEPGQAYVALSRVRDPRGLFIDGWSLGGIFADPTVTRFHESLQENLVGEC